MPNGLLGFDGGQNPRDVTFTVSCNEPALDGDAKRVTCQADPAGTESRLLAVVRVRFEPNFDVAPVPPPGQRAVIPKVMTWDTQE